MSVQGHQRPNSDVRNRSAVHPISDIQRTGPHGRKVPKADITYAARSKIKSRLPEALYADQTRRTASVSYAFESLVRCAVIKRLPCCN